MAGSLMVSRAARQQGQHTAKGAQPTVANDVHHRGGIEVLDEGMCRLALKTGDDLWGTNGVPTA